MKALILALLLTACGGGGASASFAGTQVYAANAQQFYSYDGVVAEVLVRYAQGKTPALVAKSAIQLGFAEDVILSLPGVTPEALIAGKELIASGAFAPTATGTQADADQGGDVDQASAQSLARLAAGLDVRGRPL
jgi:hypothetical protein